MISPFTNNFEGAESDELRKRNEEAKVLREKMAMEAIVKMGNELSKRIGDERMNEMELNYRAFILAWGKIMGSPLRLNVQVLEAMLAILANVPLRAGTDLIARPGLQDMQAELSALRNRIMDRNKKLAEESIGHLSTGSTGGPQATA